MQVPNQQSGQVRALTQPFRAQCAGVAGNKMTVLFGCIQAQICISYAAGLSGICAANGGLPDQCEHPELWTNRQHFATASDTVRLAASSLVLSYLV